ncbi:hypothetical protein ONZ45_g17885 [Pleurotus djamor]|nr:hypothetical protein ONZ45_g17885 [Pleurotus djamor]
MLYEGERSSLRITLENVSPLPIDFVRLVFEDSTMTAAQQALVDGNLSVFETYETEYELIHNPLFSWSSEATMKIPKGKKHVVTIDSFGKGGCTHGTIHISYGYVNRSPLNIPDDVPDPPNAPKVFHTRQVSYPVVVTVYQMLDCQNMDILPLPAGPLGDAGMCLFSVEVRNTYGIPFEVTFERVQSGESGLVIFDLLRRGLIGGGGFCEGVDSEHTTTVISPGSTARIVLPMKRILLAEDHVSREIPTLSDRQFIVSKSKLSQEEERTNRALFWYREELFKSVQGRWREVGGVRCGTLSLRKQRMSLHMLDTLRRPKGSLGVSIVSQDGLEIRQENGVYYPKVHEFVYLRIQVACLSATPETFVLDIDMVPMQHVIFQGILSSVPVGEVKSGETGQVMIPICFLCHGRFDMRVQGRLIEGDVIERAICSRTLVAILGAGTE